jgi:hypothetical protein
LTSKAKAIFYPDPGLITSRRARENNLKIIIQLHAK